jgi:hypothetical protein
MYITMVKKIKADGTPCRKCADVEQRLHRDKLFDRIDRIEIADECDPKSEGMQLAHKHKVERAPFFIVEREGMNTKIYTVYFQFVKEVLNTKTSEKDEIAEIMDSNPDIDYI